MMISIQYHHFQGTPALDALIENTLITLGKVTRIDEAAVSLAHRADQSPAFVASFLVSVPGPDFQIEARDHTADQALRRGLAMLERRMRQRHLRRERQRLSLRKHEANFHIGCRSR